MTRFLDPTDPGGIGDLYDMALNAAAEDIEYRRRQRAEGAARHMVESRLGYSDVFYVNGLDSFLSGASREQIAFFKESEGIGQLSTNAPGLFPNW